MVALHPLIDNGLRKGEPNFSGGTLECHCLNDRVTVRLSSNVAHNHACGCSKCWKPSGGLFSVVGVVPVSNLTVTANKQKLHVVDSSAVIQRNACQECGVHMYGRIEKDHPFKGLDFVHAELSSQEGWQEPQFAAFVSSIIEQGFDANKMDEVRSKFKRVGLETYDCLSPALMDLIASYTYKAKILPFKLLAAMKTLSLLMDSLQHIESSISYFSKSVPTSIIFGSSAPSCIFRKRGGSAFSQTRLVDGTMRQLNPHRRILWTDKDPVRLKQRKEKIIVVVTTVESRYATTQILRGSNRASSKPASSLCPGQNNLLLKPNAALTTSLVDTLSASSMLLRALVVASAIAVATAQVNTTAFPPFTGDAFARYNITAPGIIATFIPYGARLTNLWVQDKYGDYQDVVMGYDAGIQYVRDTSTIHSYMGGVVGRYANRIKNGTFELDGETYHIPENSGNTSTLHGGTIGYDQRNWTVVSHTTDSITFLFYDEALEGFPGDLINIATYTVSEGPRWTSRLVSIPLNKKTPVMLSNHIYWNLGAFVNPAAQHVYDNTLHMPYSSRYVQVETSQVPNGTIGTVAGTFLDFTTPKIIGSQINNGPKNSCGVNCTGYNNAFIIDRPRYSSPEDTDLVVLTMSSPQTGIQLDVRTNQQNLEIFSCNWFNGSIKAKADQQRGGNGTYDLHGCIVIEPQGWVDAINWPQWGQEAYQVYGADTEPAVNLAMYDFSIVKGGSSRDEL